MCIFGGFFVGTKDITCANGAWHWRWSATMLSAGEHEQEGRRERATSRGAAFERRRPHFCQVPTGRRVMPAELSCRTARRDYPATARFVRFAHRALDLGRGVGRCCPRLLRA